MTAAEVIKALQTKITLLEKLGDETVSGFALIIPPASTNIIDILSLDSSSDERAFYQSIVDRCMTAKQDGQLDGVGVPGYPRRLRA